jgi:hypothetical protein
MLDRKEFVVLMREAGLAAEVIAVGTTALGRADASQRGLYNQAFFNLSIGFERVGKLVVLVNHYLNNGQTFPSDAQLKSYGHDIQQLIAFVERIAGDKQLSLSVSSAAPNSVIHRGVIATLSEFAKATRYYNLDALSGGKSAAMMEPIEAWFQRVGVPILERHYRPSDRARHERQGKFLEQAFGDSVLTRVRAEDGRVLTSVAETIEHGAKSRVLQAYGRLYTLQIVRFMAHVLVALTDHVRAKHPGAPFPFFEEFFKIFRMDDRSLRKTKTWSIYH